ncbi:Protein of unknown function DUF688 [Dillenia turbinata]|uniref:Uncharacterized protein n=1 Tax=Dillenia turbinata TaxID=194707 RepID=A0AAN8ULW5_9MAGN
MEEKQLDFNQPLLSVRRISATTIPLEIEDKRKVDNSLPNVPPIPFYKSELKSGPVRNPGVVPFQWEKTPGRPKDETRPKNWGLEKPPLAPKLPPGRVSNIKELQASDKHSEDPHVAMIRRENESPSSRSVSSVAENVLNWGSLKEELVANSSDSEEGDEAFVDALDTLSRTESFSLNCSVSGLSELDGPEDISTGTFSTDPQTRDFMMGRFLPAAKAMTSEAPQYTFWKQPVARGQLRPLKKKVSWDKRPPVYHDRPDVSPHFPQAAEEDSDDDSDDYEHSGDMPTKACGLLPRFCLRSSLCLLNPGPGMKVRSQVTISSVCRVPAKFPRTVSRYETVNKNANGATSQRRSVDEDQKKLHEDKNNWRHESDQINSQSSHQTPSESSIYRCLDGGGIPPSPNETLQALFRKDEGYEDDCIFEKANKPKVNELLGKQYKNFREVLTDQCADWALGLSGPMEKTVHVDSVHLVETTDTDSVCNKKDHTASGDTDFKGLLNIEVVDKETLGSSLEDIKRFGVAEAKEVFPGTNLESDYSNHPSPADNSNQEKETEAIKSFRLDQDLNCDFAALSSKASNDGYLDCNESPPPNLETQQSLEDSYSEFPRPPPLPKSPSESWLGRTLPSLSRRNASRPFIGKQSKASSVDPKWETIVKTSKVHSGHLGFSEEKLTPVPKT